MRHTVYTSSPGDSSIGMNVAASALTGNKLTIDVNADVNETAAIVYGAKLNGLKSGTLMIGGGSPKNFLLQTEPQIQEVLGLEEKGHDYFLQFTGCPARYRRTVRRYARGSRQLGQGRSGQVTRCGGVLHGFHVALPLLTAYSMRMRKPRPLRRLYDQRKQSVEK